MAELLPWLYMADDNLVVCKDSSLLGCWQIEGTDIESGDDLDDVANQMDEVLRRMAAVGARVWITQERRPVAGYIRGHFDNPVADYIDARWGQTFEADPVYENKTFLSVALPTVGTTTFGEILGERMGMGEKLPRAIGKAIKARFQQKSSFGFHSVEELRAACTRYEVDLANLVEQALYQVRSQRLTGAALLGYLKSTASINRIAPVAPVADEYLDSYLADTWIDNGSRPYLVLDGNRRRYAAVFSLKSAPRGGALQALNALSAMSLHLRINVCWRAATRAQAEKFLSAARAFDEMRGLTFRRLIKGAMAATQNPMNGDDTPKTAVGELAESYRQLLRDGEAAFGWLAASIVVFASSPKRLEDHADRVVRQLERSNLLFMRERDGSLSGFCTGVPGQVQEVVRWHFTEAGNATDLAPLVSLDSGVPYHPFFSQGLPEPVPPNAVLRSRYNTVQYFNYHVEDVGHTLLIGPTGRGKTVFQMFLTAQFLKYRNARVFILDKDRSCEGATKMLGGSHLNLNPAVSGGVHLNPVGMARESEFGRIWLTEWIDHLLASRDQRLTSEQLEEVSKAVDLIKDDPQARLSTLATQLPAELRTRLAPWCEGGAYGLFFDHVDDAFSFGKITCTEVGSLIEQGMHDVLRAYTEYAFYRIERALNGRSDAEVGPTMIYFEEAGFLLDDPIFSSQARNYLTTLRKKFAHVVMTAQSPEPFVRDEQLGAAVRDNVSTIIFLPNTKATLASLAKQYQQAFGVSNEQLSLIAGATPKTEYCVFQPQDSFFRVCRVRLPMDIVNCLRADSRSLAALDRYYDPADPHWRDKYLDALAGA
ncbi:MAG TPA: hypothetical protein VF292_08570 [Rhodanobacteraceae bacterium]